MCATLLRYKVGTMVADFEDWTGCHVSDHKVESTETLRHSLVKAGFIAWL